MKKYIKITPVYAVLCACITLCAVVLDLATKRLIMATMTIGESIPLIKNVLHLTFITNDGAAFGSFSNHRWVFMTMSSIMLVALLVIIVIWDRRKPLFYISASMVLGGGIGNMIDRIAYGTVVDFIDFCAIPGVWKWIFNVADSFVCVGCVLLIIYYITDIAVTTVKTAANSAGSSDDKQDGVKSLTDTVDSENGEKTDGGDAE